MNCNIDTVIKSRCIGAYPVAKDEFRTTFLFNPFNDRGSKPEAVFEAAPVFIGPVVP